MHLPQGFRDPKLDPSTMSFNRLAFDIKIPDESIKADMDLTMDNCQRRGAQVRYNHNMWNLYIPEDIDPDPFRKALEECTAVSWVAGAVERHLIIRGDVL
jgi:hypothetical protein